MTPKKGGKKKVSQKTHTIPPKRKSIPHPAPSLHTPKKDILTTRKSGTYTNQINVIV
jgi:hypothetical protein